MGCTKFVVQIGRGTHIPHELLNEGVKRGINSSYYLFKDTLMADMEEADLIISHCGAGSILEAMQLKKLLILVINPSLQGNHQVEIATAMQQGNYCLCCNPENFFQTLEQVCLHGVKSLKESLKRYPEPDLTAFPSLIDGLFRWK